jgi:hypothetical protein
MIMKRTPLANLKVGVGMNRLAQMGGIRPDSSEIPLGYSNKSGVKVFQKTAVKSSER